MSGQYFGIYDNTSGNLQGSDNKPTNSRTDSSLSTNNILNNAAIIHETLPMFGTSFIFNSRYKVVTDEISMGEANMQDNMVEESISVDPPKKEGFVGNDLLTDLAIPENTIGKAVPRSTTLPAAISEESWGSKSTLYEAPLDETVLPETPIFEANAGSLAALISSEASERFRTRWNEIQGKFVDEPRTAVQQADSLVSEVVDQITRMFADEHSTLDAQWNAGGDVSTEDLRKALQHYRAFFNRLVI
jgi:hypothetical protein